MMTERTNENDQPTEASSRLRRFGLPVLAVAGAVTAGSFFAPIGLASAQDAEAQDESNESEADSESEYGSESDSKEADGRSGKRFGASGARVMAGFGDAVTETLGVTTDDLREAMQDGKSLADVAKEQGVAVSDLTAALTDAADELLDAAVADGKIDEERAAAMSQQLAERVDQMINATADDVRQKMSDRHKAAHGAMADRGEHTEELADFLGLSVDELRQSRSDGETLADLAEAQGVSEDDLVAFLLQGVQDRVDEAVAEGRVDADDADKRMADAEARIAEKVNAEPGDKSGFGRGHGKGRFGHSHDRGAQDSGTQDRGAEEGVQNTSA